MKLIENQFRNPCKVLYVIDKNEKLNQRITNLQDQFMDGNISSNDFHPMKERNEKTLIGLELKLKNLKQATSPFKTFINKDVPMLENLVDFYKNADGKTKKKILGCIFSKKIVLEKGKVATYKFTKPIQVLLNASKVFKNSDTKKEVAYDLLSCLAPLTVGSISAAKSGITNNLTVDGVITFAKNR